MKKNFGIVLAIALGLSALLLTVAFQAGWVQANPSRQERGSAGALISYQGQIQDTSGPYTGTGYFKFAIINETGSTTYWSNDGTSVAGSEPTAAVSLTVTNGLFNVNLGDTSGTYTNMTQIISYTTFADYKTLLRVWFSPDNGSFTQMPDQKVTTVPYALQAVELIFAWDADQLDGRDGSSYQLRVASPCGDGQAIKQINADGSVICESISGMPRFTLSVIHDVPSTGRYPSIAIGGDGLGLISFTNDNQILIVAHCDDLECTTATLNGVDLPAYADLSTSIAVRTNGHALISYYDSNYNSLKVAYCNNADCSDATITTVDSSLADFSNAIATISDTFAVIAYTGGPSYNLYVASCDNYNCSSHVSDVILDSTATIYSLDVVNGADDRGLIAYYDANTGQLKTAHCNNLACSSATLNTIASGISAKDISLAIGSDNLGLISFYDFGYGDLKVAHCDYTDCSSVTIHTIDDDNAGYGSSISIGMDGLGVISYYTDHGDMKVAHCTNLECSAATLNTLHDTDDSYYPGYWTALTIGKDGLPLIAYQRRGNETLNSAHCSNIFCFPAE